MAHHSQHDQTSIHQAISVLADAIAQRHRHTPRLLLLGIANGGIELTNRLLAQLALLGIKANHGTIDISFHRDDIGSNPIPKEHAPTMISHDVNGATVILVDDVLHSGRTVKAALDELFDHGRPASVELAVLVDRGGRLLPVAATYSGLTIAADSRAKVIVSLAAGDPARDTILVRAPAPHSKLVNLKK